MAIIDNEKRQERKAERQEKRDAKLDTRLGEEKTRLGMTDTPVSPLGPDRKAAIDKEISSIAAEKYREGLKKMQEGTQLKTVADPAAPTDEQLKQSLRKERRAKTSDILTALGRGLQGKSIDPSSFKSSRIRKDREDLYNQFKEASKGAKARREEYEQGYRQQQIEYLKDLASKETSDLKRREIESRIAKEQELANKYAVEAKWKEKQPYYKPSTAKDGKKDMASYSYKTEDGQTLKMDVSKEDANKLNRFVLAKEDAKKKREELEQKMNTELYGAKSEGIMGLGKSKEQVQDEIRAKYAPDISLLDQKLADLETNISDTFKKNESTPEASTETDGLDPWDL